MVLKYFIMTQTKPGCSTPHSYILRNDNGAGIYQEITYINFYKPMQHIKYCYVFREATVEGIEKLLLIKFLILTDTPSSNAIHNQSLLNLNVQLKFL
jgi:hypothetical protein